MNSYRSFRVQNPAYRLPRNRLFTQGENKLQHTLAKEIVIKGIGLHSGCESMLTIKPAEINHGIVFVRTDLPEKPSFRANYNQVVDTRNCTCLGDAKGNIVSTIEHLMAALAVCQVDNALIEITNPETPIMDGSALPFYQAIKNTGVVAQSQPRKLIKVVKPVRFDDGKGAVVELLPADEFAVHFTIDFPSKIVGHQEFSAKLSEDIFASQIAPCRTFCEKYQVDYLKSIGLIKGGSLYNAVVLDGETILNEGGFRVENECVNHKVIDAIGDMYTAGYQIIGKLIASKSGHYHNNQILKVLFSDKTNYQIIEE